MKIKGSFYKNYIDKVNNKQCSFHKERKHIKEIYQVPDNIVDCVFDNFYNIEKVLKDNEYKEYAGKEYLPDYNYENEMMELFEDFKNELMYDGFYDLSKLIKLSHFYFLFQEGYIPCF